MSKGQWTVLTILLIIAGIEALFSPTTAGLLKGTISGQGPIDPNKPIADQLAAPATGLIGFTLGVLVLLWVADAFPGIATGIASLLLVIVLLRYSSQLGGFLNVASSAVTTLSGKGTNNGGAHS